MQVKIILMFPIVLSFYLLQKSVKMVGYLAHFFSLYLACRFFYATC